MFYGRAVCGGRVFPAPAGINRPISTCLAFLGSVPRASGDKPRMNNLLLENSSVFPAPAGINLTNAQFVDNKVGVPRASGDKPSHQPAL
ncbi:hypothetical protein J7D79_001957 [Salmonella enterica]|nr:hypothetical protein [Salmonella enterica]